jgi:maleylacetate reductase
MPHSFVYEALPLRVIFGTLTPDLLKEETAKIGATRPLIVATALQKKQAFELSEMLGGRAAGVYAGALMHTPVDTTETALRVMRDLRADGIVGIGGGSTTGLTKAIALRTGLPQLAIPTTYAGSEMTPILGETENGIKRTQTTRQVLPKTVIYDVQLTLSLPVSLSASSGLNAIAHGVEALYAKDRNPIVSMMAAEGIKALYGALPSIAKDPLDLEARSQALYGAWLCGVCLGSVGMSLHHKLCHTLGGMFNLPHAETHAIVLPHALAYNGPSAPEAIQRLSETLLSPRPELSFHTIAKQLGIGGGLRKLGMPEEGINAAADQAIRHPYWNPRPIERDAMREVIRRAWAGEEPSA